MITSQRDSAFQQDSPADVAAVDAEEVPAVRFNVDSQRISTSSSNGSSHHALAGTVSSASSDFQGAAMGRYDETNQVLKLEVITSHEARVRFVELFLEVASCAIRLHASPGAQQSPHR